MNQKTLPLKPSVAGFTLIETLVVVIMIGVLAAITVPSWVGFIARQRLNTAQEQALVSLRNAQSNAKQEKTIWQTCFYNNGTKVLYSVHAVPDNSWDCSKATNWQSLLGERSNSITINTTYSTLDQSPTNYYRVQFGFDGFVKGGAGKKITFNVRNGGNNPKRCIDVSTILGALRTAQDDDCI